MHGQAVLNARQSQERLEVSSESVSFLYIPKVSVVLPEVPRAPGPCPDGDRLDVTAPLRSYAFAVPARRLARLRLMAASAGGRTVCAAAAVGASQMRGCALQLFSARCRARSVVPTAPNRPIQSCMAQADAKRRLDESLLQRLAAQNGVRPPAVLPAFPWRRPRTRTLTRAPAHCARAHNSARRRRAGDAPCTRAPPQRLGACVSPCWSRMPVSGVDRTPSSARSASVAYGAGRRRGRP